MRSSVWLREHYKDRYAQVARNLGLRSRSWFKLQSIDRVDMLFCSGMTVVDLGAAPGGWSLYIKDKVGNTGNIIACDILPMQHIDGVCFFKGSCVDENFLKILFKWTKNKKVQVVLSDMSPNMTGVSIVDANKSIYLGNIALEICRDILMPGGDFLVKVFQGLGFNEYLYSVRHLFRTIKVRKPDASRCRSREVYIVAKEYKRL